MKDVKENHGGQHGAGHHYRKLGVMFGLHFIAMYFLMYAMVHDLAANVYNSLNEAYMAGLMTASMGVIEIALMGAAYPDKKRNATIFIVSLVALFGCWTLIRQQTAIRDRQFLFSMIPHHAGAILMCKEANISDPEVRDLCKTIVSGQQQEIDQMKAILRRMNQ